MNFLAFELGTWMAIGALSVVAILLARFIARRVFSSPGLDIQSDDPAFDEAALRAQDELPRFRDFLKNDDLEGFLKVRLGPASDEIWAKVTSAQHDNFRVSAIDSDEASENEVEPTSIRDWQVLLADGRIAGGYSQRLLFQRAREKWGKLPRGLQADAARYVDHVDE